MQKKKLLDFKYGSVDTERMVINLGPQHPSTHGVLRLETEVEGEIVSAVWPRIGYLHRCFEKCSENSTYPQVIPFTDRLDYISSLNNELPYVLGMEKLLGIEVPEKVTYIRTILSELNRIANHQIALGTFVMDAGAYSPFLYFFMDRELILKILENCSGGRLLYNYFWIGGLQRDIYPAFKDDCLAAVKAVRERIKEADKLFLYNKILIERTANVGILPADVAINFSCSGPMLRGSGVPYDVRKTRNYLNYDKFDWSVAVGKGEVGTIGDCWDRMYVRLVEMEESCKIIEQALEQMPFEGDVRAALPKRIKPPVGEFYYTCESPKGELGYYITSDGSPKPSRVRCRSCSFSNLSVLPFITKGYMIADLIMILASVDIVLGEVDR
ncbi:MAG: NADH-quinone oxidoreductase subunit D [Bacteroidetes bacterium]|nr:NADH-quinone oxidoreductase subunit D [Bacteroidota bacterium]MBR3090528.1 NADH-quinone oxidoreductase subunit D [Bacteroidota bacterium]